jgi:DNA-directed RNA polymerase subunit E'/Rpb7
MNKIVILMTTISMTGLLSASIAMAQQPMMGRGMMGSGGWGMGGSYQRLYNPKTVETITGEVVAIDSMMPMGGMSGGVHLQVRTPKNELISIHLGPSWYLERQDISLQVKDKIQVKGSKVSISDKPALIAAEVKKGAQTLVLRDADGFPVWSGWRKRS